MRFVDWKSQEFQTVSSCSPPGTKFLGCIYRKSKRNILVDEPTVTCSQLGTLSSSLRTLPLCRRPEGLVAQETLPMHSLIREEILFFCEFLISKSPSSGIFKYVFFFKTVAKRVSLVTVEQKYWEKKKSIFQVLKKKRKRKRIKNKSFWFIEYSSNTSLRSLQPRTVFLCSIQKPNDLIVYSGEPRPQGRMETYATPMW